MHVLLTHEQADFDALGALLGASLVYEHAIPLLPHRLNRNARAYLTLYGAELPFIEAQDLPSEPLELVTLVDTQSLVTLKGTGKHTKVQVLDHHQPRPDLPQEWQVKSERVGACTTLLVEEIREQGISLNVVQATMLLLGIYEDTGSMTYVSTTIRDVNAAAFLLEQGASLRIATGYLNPPLSAGQRQLYDRLLKAVEQYIIHGQTIIVSLADAGDMDEEISSVAHKLRDLLDPDAMFLLVTTREGIRLIARSTTDQVNVAAIASSFGGGGHERAAAALIHPHSFSDGDGSDPMGMLQKVQSTLMALLPGIIRPSITVGMIMSRRPRLITPQTSAKQAAALMARYGYEGYPVVENGRVVGLLTRRAVDRAITHRLNLPASSLMDAGEVTIHLDDSLQTLQRRMADSGWGQVPVVDGDPGNVIGIVTRTDLLKNLAGIEIPGGQRQNLSIDLEKQLPPARLGFLRLIAEKANNMHMPLYIVGGFVRDLLLRRPGQDFDLVVEGDGISLARALAEQYGGRVVSHTRFGTAKWQITSILPELTRMLSGNEKFKPEDLPESPDLVSSRIEFYDYPTALPQVERGSIKVDLRRRDFTINTMAVRLDGRHFGELYDFFNGFNDLRQGKIRVLHPLSFVDDPTRLLRAVRFEQRFSFTIEDRTRELMEKARPLLRQVSGERVRHELDLIFSEERAASMLARLESMDLLRSIHPDLRWSNHLNAPLGKALHVEFDEDWGLDETLGNVPLSRALFYIIWLMDLGLEKCRKIANRLRFPHHLLEALITACLLREEMPTLAQSKPSVATTRLDGIQPVVLAAFALGDLSEEAREMLHTYATDWRHRHATVDGNDLRSLGLPPGPYYRQILDLIRAAWLDGKIQTTSEEKQLLAELVQSHKGQMPSR